MISNRILVIDDSQAMQNDIGQWLNHFGYITAQALTAKEALKVIKLREFSVILLDLMLPDMDGFELLSKLHKNYPDICIITMTGYDDIFRIEQARKLGAFDFFTKPLDWEGLGIRVDLAYKKFRDARKSFYQQADFREAFQFKNILGKSTALHNVLRDIEAVAGTEETVLILGETGTGKELVAHAIHTHSSRKNNPIVYVNCGAITESLAESELFGHEQGAFTGAEKRSIGKCERADQSTLFLDEIGELSTALQTKLLRFLQEKTFERVGGNEQIFSDVRIIAATNRNLDSAVEEGLFREDLFHRLSRFTITVPPLRDRVNDIELLADHNIKKCNKMYGKSINGIAPDALKVLKQYAFPGNIRELENIISRAMLYEQGTVLGLQHIQGQLENKTKPSTTNDFYGKTYREALEEFEQAYLAFAMEHSGGVLAKAARFADLDRGHFRDKLKKHGLHNGKNGSGK